MTNFEIALIICWVSGATLAALFIIGTIIELVDSTESKRCTPPRQESPPQLKYSLQLSQ